MKKQFTSKQEQKLKDFTINGKLVVESIWYEDDCGEMSVWISLRDGFNWDGCSCVHEESFRDALAQLWNVSEGEPY